MSPFLSQSLLGAAAKSSQERQSEIIIALLCKLSIFPQTNSSNYQSIRAGQY